MNLSPSSTFFSTNAGRLGLSFRKSASSQIGRALKQLHLDAEQVEACVDEIYPRFMQSINYAHFEREACFVYALQSMFAVTVLTHGAIDDEVDAFLVKTTFKSEANYAQLKSSKFDELVAAELFRIGFIDNDDDDVAKCFKRMMFGEALAAMLEESYCRVGAALRASIDRVVHEHLNQDSFEEPVIHGVFN